jgi:anti-sigma factor RsiW
MRAMNDAGDCALVRAELGVYLLGAIGPADRSRVGRHLASCTRCRDELAGLAGLPGLLGTVPSSEVAVAWADDPAEPLSRLILDPLIRRVTRIRGRRRLAAALAAVFLAGLAAAAALQTSQRPLAAPAPQWIGSVSRSSAATGVWAEAQYARQPWGTELQVQITGIPAGTRCQLIVTGAGGQVIAAGSQPGWYPGSVPLPPASLRQIAVTCGGKTLVSIPARLAG